MAPKSKVCNFTLGHGCRYCGSQRPGMFFQLVLFLKVLTPGRHTLHMQLISQHAAFSSWLPWPTFSKVPLAGGKAPVKRRKSSREAENNISSFPVLIVVLVISSPLWATAVLTSGFSKPHSFPCCQCPHQLSVSTIDLLRIADFLQTQTERHSFSSASSRGCKWQLCTFQR